VGARNLVAPLVATAILVAGCGGDSSSGAEGAGRPATSGVPGVGGTSPAGATSTGVRTSVAGRASTATTRWPSTFQIGLLDGEDGASALVRRAPYGIRWAYLSGGAGDRDSWVNWREGDGSYATAFVKDSFAHGTVPFLSYYVLQQTTGVKHHVDEQRKVIAGLRRGATVRRVVRDLRRALQRIAKAGPGAVVLQVEPDLWGYAQQRHGDDARRTPVSVRAVGGPLVKGLPNDLSGLARLVTRIRDRDAPHVMLAYPVSIWGTNKDIVGSKPDAKELDRMVRASTRFWRTAGRPFDLLTFEYANRTTGYMRRVDGLSAADTEWSAVDHERLLTYVRGVLRDVPRPGVLWQVPPGNTVMAAMDDSPGHYRDDKVQTLLGRPGRPLLRRFRDAGIAAVLFGSAFPDDTCACDARRDGITDGSGGPAPNPAGRRSTSTDDDGGYLAEQTARYVRGGPLRIKRVPRRVGR